MKRSSALSGPTLGLAVGGDVCAVAVPKKIGLVNLANTHTHSEEVIGWASYSRGWGSSTAPPQLDFSIRPHQLAFSSQGNVIVWDIAQNKAIKTISISAEPINCINWSSFNRNTLVVASNDKHLRVIDIRQPSGGVALAVEGGTSQAKFARSNASRLASSHRNGVVKLWDLRAQSAVSIRAHESRISSLDWSYTSDELVTCAEAAKDKETKVWDTKYQSPILVAKFDSGLATRVAFTPFGKGLVTAHSVKTRSKASSQCVFMWSLDSLRQNVTRIRGFPGSEYFAWWGCTVAGNEVDYRLVTRDTADLIITNLSIAEYKTLGHRPSQAVVSGMEQQTPRSLTIAQEVNRVRRIGEGISVALNTPLRTCEATIAVGQRDNLITVRLEITIPPEYPKEPLRFKLLQEAGLKSSDSVDLIHALAEAAGQAASKRRPSLELCVRNAVAFLEKAQKRLSSGTSILQQQRISSTRLDAPMAPATAALSPGRRTCGAIFSPSGLLVCFANQSEVGRTSTQPRSSKAKSSAAGHPSHRGSAWTPDEEIGDHGMFLHGHKRKHKRQARHASPQRHAIRMQEQLRQLPLPVFIKEVKDELLPSRTRAELYALPCYGGDPSDAQQTCQNNADIARNNKRNDVAQCFQLAARAMDVGVVQASGMLSTWQQHPFGPGLLSGLLKHLLKSGDAQSAATLASAVLAFGTHFGGKSAFVSDDIRLVVHSVMLAYSNLLYAWRLPQHAAIVAKHVAIRADESFLFDAVAYQPSPDGQFEEEMNRHLRITCSVCRLQVRGVTSLCLHCGHGGHLHHLESWFKRSQYCPTGCGCLCHHTEVSEPDSMSFYEFDRERLEPGVESASLTTQ